MQEELLIALGARDWRCRRRQARQSYPSGGRRDLIDDANMDRRVSNDPLAHLGTTRFELGLDQRNHVATWPQDRWHDGQDLAERDERDVDDDEVDQAWQITGGEVARIEAFDDDHTRIVSQRPVELAVADVERDHARRAALEQGVGEPSGRSPDVERLASLHSNAKRVEPMGELDASTADVRMVGRCE